jgi:LmbE family N-acetylglucosaminyl deacetylase
MALWADAGHTVTAAYLTRGEAGIKGKSHSEAARIRTGEAEDACRILGAHPVFMSQVDGSTVIDESRYEEVYRFLEDENPDIVVTHWPIDTHRDHRICSLLVYDAWLRLQRSFSLYYFEVMSGLQSQNFQPTQYIDITSVAERKHRACFAHESQGIREEYPNDHGQMEIFRGLEAGYSLAEAFIRHTQSHHIPLK